MKLNKSNTTIIIVTIIFLIIYIVFPTINSSVDAWGYAAYVKLGENLFLSHHLFYNALGFVWVKLIGLAYSFDTLKLLITLNALFAVATLYVFGKTIRLLGVEGKRLIIWVVFIGSSWAIMRFATENETYIIPLFFSMLGSYFFIKSLKKNSTTSFFLSGFFVALACLVHQVMFFWWLSLLIGVAYKKKIKPFVWFALPALLVPLSYILVLVFYNNQSLTLDSLMRFVFRDYYSGAAGVSMGISSLIFSAISMVRSFFQVHGYFAILPRISSLFVLGGVIAIGFLIVGLISLKQTQWNFKRLKDLPIWVHLLAMLFQIVFAFLSSGNAEFMVMIPILFAIVLSQIVKNETRFIGFIATGMLIWNVTLGLIPLNRYSLDSNTIMFKKVLESQVNQEKQLFVLFNRPGVENRVKYFTKEYPKNLITGTQYDSINHVIRRINNALANDSAVYTDCINRPKTLSREALVVSTDNSKLFSGFNLIKIDSAQTLTGEYYINAIAKTKGEQ
ncbi:MAG: hypothetical protein HOO91_12245 [Bacteroidales bacterium]|nr:hypothetical protein [Bacteroidales bacterium]